MSTSSIAAPIATSALPAEGRFRSSWIISQREDLTWFIGSAAAGYLAIALMWAGFPLLPLQAVWFFGVDGPHVLATVTRTYFDKAERRKLGWFLWILAPLLLIGPVAAMTGHAALFFLAAFVWQQFHVVKQHFGFVMLYKAKNRERYDIDRKLDRWFLLASLFAPLGLFVLKTQQLVKATTLETTWLAGVVVVTYATLTSAWLIRQGIKWREGAQMNWPKLALLAAVVPLQWLALGFGARFGVAGSLQAAIPLGLFHGLQYHRLLWFHNRNRYSIPGAAERNGMAVRLASSVSIYLTVAIGLHFLITFMPQYLFPGQTMQAAIWGIAFTHYCLDAKIWRVRSDKELAVALRLA
ncbi:MAG TPA: hypothetical protein VGG72_18520 [Bryobacteraceae bacterium]